MVIDTTNSAAFTDSLLFASNFMLVNRNDYGLQNSDIALIVVASPCLASPRAEDATGTISDPALRRKVELVYVEKVD